MKVLVTGSREWRSRTPVLRALLASKATVVIHGGARGADGYAKWNARALGIPEREYPADWDRYGRAAGPLRNQEMLDKEHLPEEPIDLVLAFPLEGSIGTWDMVKRAEQAGIAVKVCGPGYDAEPDLFID